MELLQYCTKLSIHVLHLTLLCTYSMSCYTRPYCMYVYIDVKYRNVTLTHCRWIIWKKGWIYSYIVWHSSPQITNMYPSYGLITMTSQWARWRLKSPSRLFTQPFVGRRSQNTSKLRVIGLWEGNPPVTGGFPAQIASNAECFHLMTASWLLAHYE